MRTIKQGLQQLAHLGLRVFLKIHCGMRVHGAPRLDQPSILVANHASHIDIAAIFAALPISQVTKVRTAAARDTIYALPGPLVANPSWPGCARAIAISCLVLLAGIDIGTTRMFAARVICDTGTKSR